MFFTFEHWANYCSPNRICDSFSLCMTLVFLVQSIGIRHVVFEATGKSPDGILLTHFLVIVFLINGSDKNFLSVIWFIIVKGINFQQKKRCPEIRNFQKVIDFSIHSITEVIYYIRFSLLTPMQIRIFYFLILLWLPAIYSVWICVFHKRSYSTQKFTLKSYISESLWEFN